MVGKPSLGPELVRRIPHGRVVVQHPLRHGDADALGDVDAVDGFAGGDAREAEGDGGEAAHCVEGEDLVSCAVQAKSFTPN